MPSIDSEWAARYTRFALVGALNGIVTLVVYVGLNAIGSPYPVSAGLGFAAGIANGYTWNRLWTFRTGFFHLPEFSRYVIVSGAGLVANVVGVIVGVEALSLDKLTAELMSLIPVVLMTYTVNRIWTFRPRDAGGDS
jgi:putative flippase GtrA